MGEGRIREELLGNLAQLLNGKNKTDIIFIGRESSEVLKISAEEFEQLRHLRSEGDSGSREVPPELGNFVSLPHLDDGTSSKALVSTHGCQSNWILDSGASKHVTGTPSEFETFTLYPQTHKETIETADGTSQPVRSVGIVQCSPSITLSSVLYAPSFPVNLVSVSSLVDHMDCRVIIDKEKCQIEERKTGRKLGSGIRHNGLWYLDRKTTDRTMCSALATVAGDQEARVILQHCRLGYMSFDTMSKIFPEEMKKVERSKLVCDGCEYGKHTRTSYVSRGLRSTLPFVLIHSDVWISPVISVSGMKYFITFIDCYSRMTWIYLMKHKSEVFRCFQDFMPILEINSKPVFSL